MSPAHQELFELANRGEPRCHAPPGKRIPGGVLCSGWRTVIVSSSEALLLLPGKFETFKRVSVFVRKVSFLPACSLTPRSGLRRSDPSQRD